MMYINLEINYRGKGRPQIHSYGSTSEYLNL